MTIEFRIPIKMISFLNNEFKNTPDIKLTYDGGNKTIVFDTPMTGDNGFVSLPINTNVYKTVIMVEIKISGSGAINSLEYPYCPRTPTTTISIKKCGPT